MAEKEQGLEKKALEGTPPMRTSFAKKYGLILALIVLVIVLALPTPKGLSIAGQRMLGVLCFAVVTWITEAVTYPVSATLIASLMLVLLGTAPSLVPAQAAAGKVIGFGKAVTMTFNGISAGGTVLVGAAMFLAAAMTNTGLDKRIALTILSKVGSKTSRIVAGMIFVGFVLAFFVPSTTARVGCIIPIVLGIIAAFGLSNQSRFAALLMVVTVHAASIWNIGIKTAAAQNMVALGFIERELGGTITWLHWFVAAAPYAAIMSVWHTYCKDKKGNVTTIEPKVTYAAEPIKTGSFGGEGTEPGQPFLSGRRQ